jgi:hypothetical protein
MEAISFSETFIKVYQTTRRHIPEYSTLLGDESFASKKIIEFSDWVGPQE